jgi:hypothetical protein
MNERKPIFPIDPPFKRERMEVILEIPYQFIAYHVTSKVEQFQ